MKPLLVLTALAALIMLTGCEALSEFSTKHPVLSGIGMAALAGGIGKAASSHGHTVDPHDVHVPPDLCGQNPASCR